MITFLKDYLLFLYKSPKLFFRYLYKPLYVGRKKATEKYIKGTGIEIGPLAFPLVPIPGSRKLYVDKLTKKELDHHFLERYGKRRIFYPDIVTDGEKLDNIAPDSLDFIYTSHFLEHCQDPITTIESHLSRLKVGGHSVYIIPDRSNVCDKDRQVTPVEHFIKDYKNPQISKMEHLEDIAKVEGLKPGTQDYKDRVAHLDSIDGLMHYHVFDIDSYRGFFEATQKLLKNHVLVNIQSNPATDIYEHIAIIRKTA